IPPNKVSLVILPRPQAKKLVIQRPAERGDQKERADEKKPGKRLRRHRIVVRRVRRHIPFGRSAFSHQSSAAGIGGSRTTARPFLDNARFSRKQTLRCSNVEPRA